MRKEELEQVLKDSGLTVAWEFVPQSNSSEPDNERINWKATLKVAGRKAWEGNYFQGIGHLPFPTSGLRTIDRDNQIKYACENGLAIPLDGRSYIRAKKLPFPSIADLMACLLLDGDAVNFENFESWANHFGYDSDSRKAESIYKACLETGLKLRYHLGEAMSAKLRELLQDY